MPSTRELTVGLDGRHLVLVPTVGGGAGRLVGFDLPGVVYLAYPVPGQASLGERRSASPLPPGADSLDQVLGSALGQLLRSAAGPLTMGKLAAAVGCSPRMTTYHCTQLEAAGLIVRERHGQSVWVSRTTRGTSWSSYSANSRNPSQADGRSAPQCVAKWSQIYISREAIVQCSPRNSGCTRALLVIAD